MKLLKKLGNISLAAAIILSMGACSFGGKEKTQETQPESTTQAQETSAPETLAPETEASTTEDNQEESATKNGDIYILFTSDVHCGVDQGFGYVGLQQVRSTLEKEGYTTILVDDGDSIQGESIGLLSKGEAIIELMNVMKYDVAIPGNHEFDYGMERFLELTEMADFPYISCNFNKEGELVFKPYTIIEAADKKIGFVGVTTPQTIVSSTPEFFQDENGNYIYDFMQDQTGEKLYAAVQKAVDDARAEGADYIYVIGHMGMEANASPWTYADVIEHTNGIDVFLDGHSHDAEQVVMKNKDGNEVVRSAVGTKLSNIGYSHISAEDGIVETNIWNWSNSISAPKLFNLHNDISDIIDVKLKELDEQLSEKLADNTVFLTINDPNVVDDAGNPIRMIRRAETNLGDFCTDAFRLQGEADIAFIVGGNIRADFAKGDVSYKDVLNVFPYGNYLCVIEVTGQQILDALEWGARAVPEQNGGFLQVSGLSYEIDVAIPSGCKTDENSMCAGIEGERRVRNVLVGGEPIDVEKKYTVAGTDYTLLGNGDGYTSFDGAEVLREEVKIDTQVIVDHFIYTYENNMQDEYADPYGQGRITIIDDAE